MSRLPNTNALRAFVFVAQEGSVSRAAELLNLTQPAISHQIKRLSDDAGVVLFSRTQSGLKLTQEGAALLPKAEAALECMQEFQRSVQQQSGRIAGKLKIGTIIDPEFIRLGAMLTKLKSEQPGIQTELFHGVSGNVLEWLSRGRLDAGFYLCAPDELTNITASNGEPVYPLHLANFQYRVIAPPGWRKAVENSDWSALAALPWIGTPKTSVHNRLLAKVFENLRVQPKTVALVDQEASMLEMVRAGLGLSLCRESIALHQKQSAGIAVCSTVSLQACLCFITLHSERETPTILETLKIVRRLWP